MTACIRGCTIRQKHEEMCPVDDYETTAKYETNVVPWLDQWQWVISHTCHGCKPRQASNGTVCATCHHRLTDWLTGVNGLTWVHWWLGRNLAASGSSAARQDWQRVGTPDGHPTPLSIAVHDLRTHLSDRVLEVEDAVRDLFDRPSRDTPFNIRTACQFLNAWLTKIEDDGSLVGYVYEKLEEPMRDAGAIRPWRDRPRRLPGIPCPECDKAALAVMPGEENVTCRDCDCTLTPQRYLIWTHIASSEWENAS